MADDDVTQGEHDGDGDDSPVIKTLREKAKRADEAEAEAAAARRELVFLRAGIDTDSKLGALLLKSYDGELTVEAVKAYGQEIGAIGAASGTPAVQITDDEKALAADRAVLAGGRTEPVQDEGEHPAVAGIKAFHADVHAGKPREHAVGQFFDRVFDAAAKGDQRVLYDRDRWKEEIGF